MIFYIVSSFFKLILFNKKKHAFNIFFLEYPLKKLKSHLTVDFDHFIKISIM